MPLFTAQLSGSAAQFLAQIPSAAMNVLADISRAVTYGLGDVVFDLVELVRATGEFLLASLGETEHLATGVEIVRHQPFGLEPREPRIDRPGGRRVRAEEAVLEEADQLVSVAGLLVQQVQQIETEPAVREDPGVMSRPPTCSTTGRGRRLRSCVRPERSATPSRTAPRPPPPCRAGRSTSSGLVAA